MSKLRLWLKSRSWRSLSRFSRLRRWTMKTRWETRFNIWRLSSSRMKRALGISWWLKKTGLRSLRGNRFFINLSTRKRKLYWCRRFSSMKTNSRSNLRRRSNPALSLESSRRNTLPKSKTCREDTNNSPKNSSIRSMNSKIKLLGYKTT